MVCQTTTVLPLLASLILLCAHSAESAIVRVGTAGDLASALKSGDENISIIVTEDLELSTIFSPSEKGDGYYLEVPEDKPTTVAIQGSCQNEETRESRACNIDLNQGFLRFMNVTDIYLSNLMFMNGVANGKGEAQGGCISIDTGRLWMTDVGFENCEVQGLKDDPDFLIVGGRGGALSVTYGSLYMKDCSFVGNKASFGGALNYLRGENEQFAVLDSCRFEGNTASATTDTASKTSLTPGNALFQKTTQGDGGGGLYLTSNFVATAPQMVLTNNTFNANTNGVYQYPSDVFVLGAIGNTNYAGGILSDTDLSVIPASGVKDLPANWEEASDYPSQSSPFFVSSRDALKASIEADPPHEWGVFPFEPFTGEPEATNNKITPTFRADGEPTSQDIDIVPVIVGPAVGAAVLVTCCVLVFFFLRRRARPIVELDEHGRSDSDGNQKYLHGYKGQSDQVGYSPEGGSSLWTSQNSHLLIDSGRMTASSQETMPMTRMTQGTLAKAGTDRNLYARNTLCHDLDYMFINKILLVGRFELKGAISRRHGGQGVVQFATGVLDGVEYAIKFFLDQESFLQEHALYEDPDLQKMMPAVLDAFANVDGDIVGRSGTALPPFLVIEKGESLNEWAIKSVPDFWTSMVVLGHIAERLRHLHKIGLVHRDLKPENILWRPRYKEWTLIDFGCTCAVGSTARICFSPQYAAPEVMQAVEDGKMEMLVSTSVDMWSFGIIAYELLTKSRVFPNKFKLSDITSALLGRTPLPWDANQMTPQLHHQLKKLKPSVLAMLQRDPSKRPSVLELQQLWDGLFAAETIVMQDGGVRIDMQEEPEDT